MDNYIAEFPAILDIFIGVTNTTSTPIGWESKVWVGSYEVARKDYVNI